MTMARMMNTPPIAARDHPKSPVIGSTNTPRPTPPMPIPTPAPIMDVTTIHHPWNIPGRRVGGRSLTFMSVAAV